MAPRKCTKNIKAKKVPAKALKGKGGKTSRGKGCYVTCASCSGKGKVRVQKGRVQKAKKCLSQKGKTKRRLPENNHFPYFFSFCAKNRRDQGIIQSGKKTMVEAGSCWRRLTPEQKDHFVREEEPKIIANKRKPPSSPRPPPPPSSTSPTKPGPSGTQPKCPKLMPDHDGSFLFPPEGQSEFALSSLPGSHGDLVYLPLVPGRRLL